MRVVLLSGEGKLFTAGLDISDPAVLSLGAADEEDVGRKALKLRQKVLEMQESFTVIERSVRASRGENQTDREEMEEGER